MPLCLEVFLTSQVCANICELNTLNTVLTLKFCVVHVEQPVIARHALLCQLSPTRQAQLLASGPDLVLETTVHMLLLLSFEAVK